ncbi:MAG: hypothetical protein IJ864_00975 [Alphaproteobacteria bacterium]|nr:hypothetical protein [Alphaproteobacteria bacterium]
MKKVLTSLMLAIFILIGGCQEKQANNRIYVFSQPGCGHCVHARDYMRRYYRNYDIRELNIREGKNMGYLLHFARKYKIPEQTLGTPLIVMGENYVMGWGEEQQRRFNRYIKKFRPKNRT